MPLEIPQTGRDARDLAPLSWIERHRVASCAWYSFALIPSCKQLRQISGCSTHAVD